MTEETRGILAEKIKTTAHCLQRRVKCEDFSALLRCSEEIASFFEMADVLSKEKVDGFLKLGKQSDAYVWFLRHLSYRLYLTTNNFDAQANWFCAEELLEESEWIKSTIELALELRANSEDASRD